MCEGSLLVLACLLNVNRVTILLLSHILPAKKIEPNRAMCTISCQIGVCLSGPWPCPVRACFPCESVVPWSVSHTMGFPHPNDLKYAARCFSNSQDFPGSVIFFLYLSCFVVKYNLSFSLQKLKHVLKFKSSNV